MSYSIEYRTLQVSCKQETQNWTYFDDMTSESWMFTIDWKDTVSKVLPPPLLNISTIRYPGIYSHNYTSRIYEYAVNTESLICEPFSALLSVNISYTRGVRHIDHVLKDVGPIPDVTQSAYFFPYGIGKPWPNISDVPVNTPEYEDWVSTTKDRLTNWMYMHQWTPRFKVWTTNGRVMWVSLPNGTRRTGTGHWFRSLTVRASFQVCTEPSFYPLLNHVLQANCSSQLIL